MVDALTPSIPLGESGGRGVFSCRLLFVDADETVAEGTHERLVELWHTVGTGAGEIASGAARFVEAESFFLSRTKKEPLLERLRRSPDESSTCK